MLPVSLYFNIGCRNLSTDSRSSALKFHGNAIDKSQLVKKKSQLWQSVQKISLHLPKASVLKDLHMLLLNVHYVTIDTQYWYLSCKVLQALALSQHFFSTDFWNQMAHLSRSRTTDNLSVVYWAYIYSSSKAIVFSSPLYLRPSIYMIFSTFLIDN